MPARRDTAAGPPDRPAGVPEATWLARDWRLVLLRTGMRALSRLAPGQALALFDRLWFTPPRTQPRGEGMRWLARGRALDVRVHGHPLQAWSWGSGPTVLLVHGWGGNAGQMRAAGEALLARGMRVVAFDAPAHGVSGPSRFGGRRVSMIEIADALRVVAAAVGPVAGLVAHSGGCTATALALRDGWAGPARIAFLAPFALPSMATGPFAGAIGASAAVTAAFRLHVERRLGRPWTDFDIPSLPRLRALPPLLLVHDREDPEVPWTHGEAVARAWPGARLASVRGLGHRRLLRDARVLSQVADFIGGRQVARPTPAAARGELDEAFATCGLDTPR
ncbi:alpha/beta fold hydrolase [Luteimonas sp. SDU101]